MCINLLCLSAALLCYTGFQNQSLIRSTSCPCSTCCFGWGFQLQNLQEYIKISRAKYKDIFLLLQLPLQGSGKALDDNLEGACSIFLQTSFILVRHIYWIFRLLRGGWVGCRRAFVKPHLWPYALKFWLWSTATTHPHCHCTPRHPRARARLPRLVKPRHGWLGLAW